MTLIEQIRQKQISARKARTIEASLFTTLLGEAEIVGKNAGNRAPTDEEVVAVIKKFIKNNEETLKVATLPEQIFMLNAEVFALQQLLPKQLDIDTLRMITRNCRDLPDFMRYLKLEYAGRYDGKLASAVAKEMYQ